MPTSRKITKAERSLILVCLFAVLPTALAVYIVGGRDAEPQWDIPAPATRPTPNGYDSYVAAAMATVRFKPEIDPASDINSANNPPGSPYALKNYSLARREQWLKANAPMLALLNKGLTTPSMAPADAMIAGRNWSRLRQLARDMSARTRTFQLQNQPMRATMSALDTMQMGQDTTRDGNLIARLVGIAIGAIGRNTLEDWNKTINSLSASEARSAARRLEALVARDPSPEQVMTEQKRYVLLELQGILAIENWRRVAAPQPSADLKAAVSKLLQSQTTSKQTIYDNTVRTLDAQIANSKLPYSKVQSATLPSDIDVFTEFLIGPANRVILNEFRNQTSNNMLLLRLALRAYIAEKGSAPPTLSALVPGYLKTIPTDAYNDGKPLFYTPQGKTYKLWSVGPDGINNGGVPLARKPGAKPTYPSQNLLDNKGDFVAGLCR